MPASVSEPLDELDDAWATLRSVRADLAVGESIRVRYGTGGLFRFHRHDVDNLLRLAGFTPLTHARDSGSDGFIASAEARTVEARQLSCTVVVPCRNEIDNVDAIVARVPDMGTHTEIIFVDGASIDGTPDRIEELIRARPERDIKLLRQAGNTGKGGATFQGFSAAQGDVVMILDADMTVRPEDLPRFHLALAEGVADVANGSRMVYPRAEHAMPSLNVTGNKIFGVYMSWLLRTRLTDTLCGTKAFLRRDIPGVIEARHLFGRSDPWGDFDLLLAAGYLRLRIAEIPIRYVAREAGESKMRPLAHGVALARTCALGARRLRMRRG